MLSAAIAYQVLQQENPTTIEKVRAALEKHPWYANQWQARLQDGPVADRDLMLFMEAARWADDIRARDKAQNRPPWHYVNLPFKPEAQPDSVQTRKPEPVNILTTMAENERAREAQGSSLELINTGCDLFNPIFELRLLRHLRFHDPAVPTYGCITIGSEIVRYLRQRSIATTLHQIHRHLPHFILPAPDTAKDFRFTL